MPWDWIRATTFSEVSTWRTPSSSRPWVMLRTPVLQLTMTGILPAKPTARNSAAAPAEAGSMIPT